MTSSDKGQRPEIFDPDRRIVDAHHHLFVRPQGRYLADDYCNDLNAGHRIVASIFVEAGAFRRLDGPEWLRPLGEVEFANGVGAMAAGGYFDGRLPCAGIIGYADLRDGDELGRLLDRMERAAPDRFRGIRQLAMDHDSAARFSHMAARPPRGLLEDPTFREGLAQLARRGLVFDLAIYHEQFEQAAALADAVPELVFVLNHGGMVYGQDEGEVLRASRRRAWVDGLAELARRPNIACKIGGLGMPLFGLGAAHGEGQEMMLVERWRPYVEPVIAAFGADRCMMESNFPIDSATCDYRTLWNVLKRIVADGSEAEKNALFGGTATHIYRLELG